MLTCYRSLAETPRSASSMATATRSSRRLTLMRVRKRLCLRQFLLKMYHFTKTGSGQTQGKLKKEMRLLVGTFPPGSTWRRNPIPSCNCDAGSGCKPAGSNNSGGAAAYENGSSPVPRGFDCPFGTNFDVPFDYGYGQYFWSEERTHTPMFIMVDKVRAPAERGEWVLRWRWDVEQNPQVRPHLSLSYMSMYSLHQTYAFVYIVSSQGHRFDSACEIILGPIAGVDALCGHHRRVRSSMKRAVRFGGCEAAACGGVSRGTDWLVCVSMNKQMDRCYSTVSSQSA